MKTVFKTVTGIFNKPIVEINQRAFRVGLYVVGGLSAAQYLILKYSNLLLKDAEDRVKFLEKHVDEINTEKYKKMNENYDLDRKVTALTKDNKKYQQEVEKYQAQNRQLELRNVAYQAKLGQEIKISEVVTPIEPAKKLKKNCTCSVCSSKENQYPFDINPNEFSEIKI